MSLPFDASQHDYYPTHPYYQAQAQPSQPWSQQQAYAQQQHPDLATAVHLLHQPAVHVSSFDEDAMDQLDDSLTDMDWIRHTSAPEHHTILATPERRSMVAVPAAVADFNELDIMLSVSPRVRPSDVVD